ncbi:hypothetical protein V499_01522 [Pseudogymnoascus sp. VKM F-103]|nr:hypothetical protein V499_01522 [Pseudogymnoascus sp. VKM F-103]
METPSQPTLSRIALGALDVNKHLNSPLGSPKKSVVRKRDFVFGDGDAEMEPVARSLKEKLLETAEVQVEVLRETPVRVVGPKEEPRSEKRKEAPTDVEGREEGSVKVARTDGGEMGGLGLASEVEGVDAEGDERLESTQATSVRARTPSASQEVPLESSYSTVLTSPDTVPNSARESPSPTAQANTTDSELRENATALRLRLKFAMYKLKTNQHDIPLSRLELLPALPRRSSAPARPTTAVANSPPRADSEIEEPGSATPRPQNRQLMLDVDVDVDVEGLSSPEKVEMLTPLPRHMQVEATGGYEELTSSGVKGRAADGLLSLMGVRE